MERNVFLHFRFLRYEIHALTLIIISSKRRNVTLILGGSFQSYSNVPSLILSYRFVRLAYWKGGSIPKDADLYIAISYQLF